VFAVFGLRGLRGDRDLLLLADLRDRRLRFGARLSRRAGARRRVQLRLAEERLDAREVALRLVDRARVIEPVREVLEARRERVLREALLELLQVLVAALPQILRLHWSGLSLRFGGQPSG